MCDDRVVFASLTSLLSQQDPTVVVQDSGLAWYAYPFYLWLLGSLGVIVYRIVRRVQTKRSGPTAGDLSLTDAKASADTAARSGGSSAGPSGTSPAAATSHRPKLSALVMGTADHQVSALPDTDGLTPTQKLFQEELARQQTPAGASDDPATPGAPPSESTAALGSAPEPAAQRAGFFASGATDEGPSAEPAKPVAELLAGIQLPCGLAPVMSPEGSFGPHRVAFSTPDHGPAAVGREVGDELERLGYSLHSTGDTTLEARKGNQVLSVTLHPQAKTAAEDGARMFPHVPAGSVAVVFSS